MKILSSQDVINHFLAYCVISIFILGPLVILGFYFYEKEIIKDKNSLTVIHKVFFIPFKKHHIKLTPENTLRLVHLLDSPNMAKINKQEGMAGFENRGHFQVFAKNIKNQDVLIDRNSRKGEMKRLMRLLE